MTRIRMICNAYESGFGHGLKDDGLDLSKTPHSDPELGEAYQIGYDAGLEARQERKNVWKYPGNGELPEEHRDVLFIYAWRKTMNHGYYFNGHWFLYEYSDSGAVTSAIKCWTYAPKQEN